MTVVLSATDMNVFYGEAQVLWDVSVRFDEGEIIAILGPNGAGKSTVLNALAGLVPLRSGSIDFSGQDVTTKPAHTRAGEGLALVLERHRLFPLLTVRQNLLLGAYRGQARARRAESLAWVEELFPILKARSEQQARTLSGGEQQMVAVARGLMSRPRLLMVDEPTLGLAPKVAAEVVDLLKRLRDDHAITVIFVEANVQLALSIASRAYVLESGRVAVSGSVEHVRASPELRSVFLGTV
jgi:branched-chain amino acid transport system ATP-binding protein